MRVSLKWLADYVDLVLPPEELAHRLTMAGSEVSRVERIGAIWQNVFVAQVVALAPHPNADRLQLITLDYGQVPVTVVAGAFNIKVGDKVPFALEGARVFDPYASETKVVTVKPTKLRGIVSHGMACSPKELGLSDDHSGIMVLDPEAEVGRPLQDELGDAILEIDTAANRPDLLSMIGVAREVAALTGQQLRLPPIDYPSAGIPAGTRIALSIANPDLCARYSATYLEGVRIGPSPKWLRDRIAAAGMRPINNIVDVTNYVMLEWGQPLHAFDYDRLRDRQIIVRPAGQGERIVSLDGAERILTPEMLVIADSAVPVAIAGVMGGADSEVTDSTTRILLESANFNPVSIRRTARALRLPSEAARRFEKGLPAAQTAEAARRATRLMLELAGGVAAPGVADCHPAPQKPRAIALSRSAVRRVLGVDLTPSRIAATLTPLGFHAAEQNEEVVTVGVPVHRGDVNLVADLAEELARMIGYDAIPSTTLRGPLPALADDELRRCEGIARDVLTAAGFSEIICYSLSSKERLSRLLTGQDPGAGPAGDLPAALEASALAKEVDRRLAWTAWPPIALVNPLSAESDSLRITAFGSLLETFRDNLRHEVRDVLLFEIGRVYIPQDGALPEERRVITVVTGALRGGKPWGVEQEIDFFDVKGVAEVLLDRLGISGQRYVALAHPVFQQGRAAAIVARTADGGDELLGVLGEVNPKVRANFDVDQPAYLLGMDFDRMVRRATAARTYEPLPRFPAVLQDLAIIVADSVSAAQVRDIIMEAGSPLARDARLFDLYRGAPVPADHESLAYRVTFQSNERTLTDEAVNAVRERIVRALAARVGAILR